MDDAERQRTMDFILRQQAQFAAGMQRNEEEHAQFTRTLNLLGRVAVRIARQFRRDRTDLRERIAALIDAQMRAEEQQSRSNEWQAQMEESFARSDARMTRVEQDAERTRKDIAALTYCVESHDDDIRALFLINRNNSEDIAALARVVADMAGRRNGGDGAAQ